MADCHHQAVTPSLIALLYTHEHQFSPANQAVHSFGPFGQCVCLPTTLAPVFRQPFPFLLPFILFFYFFNFFYTGINGFVLKGRGPPGSHVEDQGIWQNIHTVPGIFF